jgi:hypothetical protein
LEQRRSKATKTVKQIYAQYYGYGIDDITDDFESSDIKIEIIDL